MQKVMRSIKSKLVSYIVIMLCSLLVVFCVVNGGLIMIVTQLRFTEMKKKIESAIVEKGSALTVNNSVALRTLAEENAYSAIGEIVTATVKLDPDLVYGIYMDNECLPWIHTLKNKETVSGKIKPLSDSVSIWAHNIKAPEYKEVSAEGKNAGIIEFAAPVVDENYNKFGTIRYGISTERMQKSLLVLKRNTVINAIIFTVAYFIIAGVIFIIGRAIANRQAEAITKPISDLSMSAAAITEGNYSLEVVPSSHDEIGELADHFDKMRRKVREYTENLEKMVADRTAELKAAQKELLEKAHMAGMADIASGTLHNVGNLLNSVKATLETINGLIENAPDKDFKKANKLLVQELEKNAELTREFPRLDKLFRYYFLLEKSFNESNDLLNGNLRRLWETVNSIGDVISAQQNYAGAAGFSENASLTEIVEDALIMQAGSIKRHGLTVIREYHDVQHITIQKIKLMHVFVNIIKNAKDAMNENNTIDKILKIEVSEDNNYVNVSFTDNGCGIAKENLIKIFSANFTTKKSGHGLGLHSCANFMKEMHGELRCESNGIGTGAKFICSLPKTSGSKQT